MNYSVIRHMITEHDFYALTPKYPKQCDEGMETFYEYYESKLLKTMQSAKLKKVDISSDSDMMKTVIKMTEDKKSFEEGAKKITKEWFDALMNAVVTPPNAHLIIVHAEFSEEPLIAFLKINHVKRMDPYYDEGVGSYRIVERTGLPSKSKIVPEALIFYPDKKELFIMEQKFKMQDDKKKRFYLNDYLLFAPEVMSSDYDAMKTVIQTAYAINDELEMIDEDLIPLIKKEILLKRGKKDGLMPVDILTGLFEGNEQALATMKIAIEKAGLNDINPITNYSGIGNLDTCKIKTNDDRVITVDLDDYLEGRNIITENDGGGITSIQLRNIQSITIQ